MEDGKRFARLAALLGKADSTQGLDLSASDADRTRRTTASTSRKSSFAATGCIEPRGGKNTFRQA